MLARQQDGSFRLVALGLAAHAVAAAILFTSVLSSASSAEEEAVEPAAEPARVSPGEESAALDPAALVPVTTSGRRALLAEAEEPAGEPGDAR